MLLLTTALPLANVSAITPDNVCEACDNVTSGGTIGSNEFGCPSPTWDPSLITSLTLPAGGSGNLEYVWMVTTDDPMSPFTVWAPVPNSNSADYDPGPISVTTYYRRCSRRAGCIEYVGETNIVMKEAICCDNITAGGTIGVNQMSCSSPFDPASLTNIVSPSGGSNAIEYQWVMSVTGTAYTPINADWTIIAGANDATFDPPSISQTSYYIRLSRRHGCTDFAGVSNMITIGISDDLAASATADSVTCFGGNDGSIDLTPTGGASPYTYGWSGGLGSNQDPQSLTAGTYSVTVTDVNGCTTTTSATVANGDQITVAAAATEESCNGAHNGTATVTTTSGGLTPYSYVWNTNPNQSGNTIQDLAPQTYTVTATDAQGCTATASATVQAGPSLAVTVVGTDVICFGKNQGSASVQSVGNGSGSYTYLWNDPAAQTSASITGLFAGNFTVTVTDDQGCQGTATTAIADGPQIIVTPSHTDATCNYSTDGAASVAVSGGLAPYDYIWDDPDASTTANVDSLAAGIYHVSVSDANGCTTNATVTVEAPMAAELVASGINVSCFNGSNGVVAVTVINGNPNDFNYIWDDPSASTTSSVAGLPAGTYGVTVSDNNGCLVTNTVTINQPTELVISMASTDATCGNGSDGTVSVTASGGTPDSNGNYTYTWSLQGTPNLNVLDDVSPGAYTVTVTDANGCSKIGTATINAPPVLTANLTTQNVTCNGLDNGQINLTVAGGVGAYDYAWSTGATGTAITNLTPGNYDVTVTDAVGCSAFAIGTITQPAPLTVATQKVDVICLSDTDGSAIALPSGGTQPYNYVWSTGQTTANISNLGHGTYHVTVSDSNNCSNTASVQIVPTTIMFLLGSTTDASCFASSDGSAVISVVGGTAPFTYLWNNGVSSANNDNIPAGTYSVTIVDNNNCMNSVEMVISAPPQLLGAATVVSPITNYGGSNGSVQVVPNGGVAPYSVLWNFNNSTTLSLSNLSAGTYSVTTTDAHNCSVSSTVNLVNPSKIGDFVWHDLNQNGIQDAGEPGLDSIKLHLIGATTVGVQIHLITYSDTTGQYAFDGLAAGTYQIKAELPAIHVFSPANVGSDLTDSDINPTDSTTAVFSIPIGNYESKWDVGLIELDEKINIGDFVWQDADHDGIQDQQEQGMANYTVRLYSMPSNTLVATKVTNSAGKYLFTDVMPGLYQVEFLMANLPNGSTYSLANQGTNDNIDSDPDPNTGRTPTFQVFPYTVDNLTIDAGVYKICDNVTDGGLIGYNENLCGNGADPANIVSLAPPTGGFGTIQYLWMKSTVPIYNGPGDPNWSAVPNTNAPEYNPGPINQSTYYIRCSRREGCPDYPGETNIVAKTLTASPLAQIIDHPTLLCTNEGGRFEAAIAGGGATYEWTFGADATPTAASTRVVNPVSWSTEGGKTATLTVTRFGCSATVSTSLNVGACGSPLIVHFGDVLAQMEGTTVNVQWSATGFDPNQTVFLVQRSENGVDFENLGAMFGTQQGADGMFQFLDAHPRLGDNYYRIQYRQTGVNESEGESEMAKVYCQPEGVLPIQAYPNPTAGRLTIEFVESQRKAFDLQINDAFGRVLLKQTVPSATEKVELDLSQFPIGIYWVRLFSENVREQIFKVVKSE